MSELRDEAQDHMYFCQFTVEHAPEAIFWVDAEAKCHWVNEVACQWLGYSRNELQSMKIFEFCPAHQEKDWQEYWGKVKDRKLAPFETHLQTKNGRKIPVEVSCNYIEFGGRGYACAFARDITEREKAKETIEQLSRHNEMILNAAGEGIFGLDLKGHHTFVNPAAARMLGYSIKDLFGRLSHSIWHHTKPDGRPYPDIECPIYKAYKDGQVHSGDDEMFWRKDGTSFPAEYTSTPLRDDSGKLIGAVVTFLDITERKRMAAQLLEEAKVAEVSRVLGDIGHDIKNMLMPVMTGSSLLQDELNELYDKIAHQDTSQLEKSQNTTKEINDMIRNNARRIHDRVREISDAVKGAITPPTFRSCEISKVASDVFDTLHFYASEKGVHLKKEGLDSLPSIEADERRLFNCFYNLINNAIPEVPAGGSVTLRGHAEPESQSVVLDIADTGKGMPPDVRDSLFTNRATSTKVGGTGLGTKIVKDVVDAHSGTISVESEEGKGTSFIIRLPVNQN